MNGNYSLVSAESIKAKLKNEADSCAKDFNGQYIAEGDKDKHREQALDAKKRAQKGFEEFGKYFTCFRFMLEATYGLTGGIVNHTNGCFPPRPGEGAYICRKCGKRFNNRRDHILSEIIGGLFVKCPQLCRFGRRFRH